ncbi:MAG: PAS domain S-box protein [Candidatus Omnitrophica bacterium]|nr:PAS domain S-box protein [Candidatus Omnitrophota bacterium]
MDNLMGSMPAVGLAVLSIVLLLVLNQTRKSLSLAREKSRLVTDSAIDAIVTADGSGHILSFNQAAERMFGYSASEVIGRPLPTIMPDRFRKAHETGFKRYLETGEAHVIGKVVELAGRKKSGEEFPLELSLASGRTPKGPLFSAIIRDATERKNMEETLLLKTVELARSKTELDQLELFSYVATHDLREPLYKIISFGDLLKMHCGASLDDKGRHDLQLMQDAAARMSRMIEELREFSKIGSEEIAFTPVDLNSVVQEVLSDLKLRIEESRSTVELQQLPTVRANRTQLRQLFQNLIANAIKFHADDRPSRIVIKRGMEGRDMVGVIVEDNGIGFEEKYLDRIFKPFQRLHGAARYEGSGMGLAICRKIILRHGGSITAKSAPGKGSVFTITLPTPSKAGESQ